MNYYPRALQSPIEAALFKGKVIVVYGARQVGKTTLCRAILANQPLDSLYLNCDEPDIRAALTDKTSTELKALIGARRLGVIDEAQQVRNIGLTLKLLVDTFPDIQVIASGSSSFTLANEVVEPLTGRASARRRRVMGELLHQRTAEVQPQPAPECQHLLLAHLRPL